MNIRKCSCGSVRFVINIINNSVHCCKCFKNVNFEIEVDEEIKEKRYKYSNDFDVKVRTKWLTLRARGTKKGFGCCDYEEFKEWFKCTSDECYYCSGKMVEINKKYGSIISIDRKDNSKGCFVENMVKACYVCNTIKGQLLTSDQMFRVINSLLL